MALALFEVAVNEEKMAPCPITVVSLPLYLYHAGPTGGHHIG